METKCFISLFLIQNTICNQFAYCHCKVAQLIKEKSLINSIQKYFFIFILYFLLFMYLLVCVIGFLFSIQDIFYLSIGSSFTTCQHANLLLDTGRTVLLVLLMLIYLPSYWILSVLCTVHIFTFLLVLLLLRVNLLAYHLIGCCTYLLYLSIGSPFATC